MTVALRRLVMLALAVGIALAADRQASAHKFYASLAQVERTTDGRLEVAFRFFADDLEAALRKATGRQVVVENTAAFGRAFEPWINAVFVLEAGDRRTAFKYIGAEVTVETAWVFVESAWPDPLAMTSMTNAVLVDLFPAQVNTVNVVEGGKRASVMFDAVRRRVSRLM